MSAVLWILMLALGGVGEPAPREPLPPVDLDVEGVPLGEIVSSLAALGHLEPAFEADTEDAATYPVSLRIQNMPFERALGALSGRTGLTIHVVGQRLLVSIPPARKSPPHLPESLSRAPRMLLSEYFRTVHMNGEPDSGPESKPPPLFVTMRSGRRELCWGPLFPSVAPHAIDLPIPGEDEPAVTVTQLAYDQISRRRFLAVEGPSEDSRGVLTVGPEMPVSLEWRRGEETLVVAASSEPGTACEPRPHGGIRHLPSKGNFFASWTLRLEEDQALPETVRYRGCFDRQAGETGTEGRHRDVRGGPFKDVEIVPHVSRDGRSVALVLSVGAVWLDPHDGRLYYAAQFAASDGFVTPERGGTVAAKMEAGAAASTPVELLLFAEENRDGCRDQPRAEMVREAEVTR